MIYYLFLFFFFSCFGAEKKAIQTSNQSSINQCNTFTQGKIPFFKESLPVPFPAYLPFTPSMNTEQRDIFKKIVTIDDCRRNKNSELMEKNIQDIKKYPTIQPSTQTYLLHVFTYFAKNNITSFDHHFLQYICNNFDANILGKLPKKNFLISLEHFIKTLDTNTQCHPFLKHLCNNQQLTTARPTYAPFIRYIHRHHPMALLIPIESVESYDNFIARTASLLGKSPWSMPLLNIIKGYLKQPKFQKKSVYFFMPTFLESYKKSYNTCENLEKIEKKKNLQYIISNLWHLDHLWNMDIFRTLNDMFKKSDFRMLFLNNIDVQDSKNGNNTLLHKKWNTDPALSLFFMFHGANIFIPNYQGKTFYDLSHSSPAYTSYKQMIKDYYTIAQQLIKNSTINSTIAASFLEKLKNEPKNILRKIESYYTYNQNTIDLETLPYRNFFLLKNIMNKIISQKKECNICCEPKLIREMAPIHSDTYICNNCLTRGCTLCQSIIQDCVIKEEYIEAGNPPKKILYLKHICRKHPKEPDHSCEVCNVFISSTLDSLEHALSENVLLQNIPNYHAEPPVSYKCPRCEEYLHTKNCLYCRSFYQVQQCTACNHFNIYCIPAKCDTQHFFIPCMSCNHVMPLAHTITAQPSHTAPVHDPNVPPATTHQHTQGDGSDI